ncbi:MAG: hypothetical protein IPK83_08420 [Planctomycetes bacterium]|nr:hypothetical protein [Planctomycetota bacterium]
MKSFLRRILAIALFFPIALSSANAQNPPPAKTEVQKEVDALRAYMTSRLNFVKEHYALDAAKTAQIEGWMDSLISQQKAYDDLHALTLRRRERVLSSMLSQLSGASEQTKSQIGSRMQAQIYAIHTAAPLSLANFARQSESILTPDMVDLGRKLIISKYPQVFPTGVFNVDLLEKIITPPIELGSGTDPLASRSVPQPPNPAKAKAIEEARSSGAEAMPPDKSFNRDIRSAAAESSVATKPQPERRRRRPRSFHRHPPNH